VKTRRLFAVAAALALIPAAMAAAGGFGGSGFGYQYFDAGLSTASYDMTYIMGYGYGTGWDGGRFGGFGVSMISPTGDLAGGVGGVLAGHEWRAGALVAAFTLFTGVGGVGVGTGDAGYMIGFGELDFELGLRVFPWMQAVAYVGYQAWGNLAPGPAFNLLAFCSPVVGIRLGWGG
jgi:hypothetical protein